MHRKLISLFLLFCISFSFATLVFASSKSSSDVYVHGYYRKDGTYVKPYYRTAPDATKLNNFSHCGNVNPYTGKTGTTDCGMGAGNSQVESISINVAPVEPSLPTGSVKVTLPSFQVKVNGQLRQIPNTLRKYPLIVYKDITYFPMTWNYTHALGLETSWSSDTGFSIRKSNNTSQLLDDEYGNGNYSDSYVATIPSYNVFLNDTWVDNSNEPYPVLSFRDITYFPMTWHFAKEELGLTTSWSSAEGLGIQK